MNQLKLQSVLSRGVEKILPETTSLAKLMAERKIRLYLGIDPTGSLLTLGHAVVLRKLQQFAELGHEVILLIGNGTVRIGDPTGKDTTRPELSDSEIEANFKNWQKQAEKVLDFSKITIKHNGDWLDQLKLPDFIKLMAKSTVQQLMERDMFGQRIANNLPIHTHELMYPLLQGYDSVAMDVDLEIGGSDQLFNMMMGRYLQKVYRNKQKWVLTTPIINGLDGRKMSKSYGNFVALTEKPNDMYGKLMAIADSQIVQYFTLLTDVSDVEIEQIAQAINEGENPMIFKKQLAKTITGFYHSKVLAVEAEKEFEKVVQKKQIPDQISEVTLKSGNQPTILAVLALCLPNESSNQLKRLIAQGGVELTKNQYKPQDYLETIKLVDGEILRIGKRQFFKLKVK